MKIKDYKCKCGYNDFFFADKGNQKGIYCSYCGKWLKWADKDEQNLAVKQEPVLDKIRVEITSLDTIMLNDNPKKVSAYVKLSDVREVIDKYREEY